MPESIRKISSITAFCPWSDYEAVQQGDTIVIEDTPASVRTGTFRVEIPKKAIAFPARLEVSEEDKALLLAGGALNYLRKGS